MSQMLRLVALVLSLAALGRTQDDFINPYDMLNYDAGTKSMRKQPEVKEPTTYPNGEEAALGGCGNTVAALKREVEEQQKIITSFSNQPTCSPVFKRFLTRLLKLINEVGLPTDNTDTFYNAKVKITRQGVAEIQKFLESGDSWRNGAMDDALSQLLIAVKPLDYEAWKWHFEDSFGVEIDTVLKVFLSVLIIVAIICTQLWSVVSWFVQFKRMFAICFLISIVWNWLYLYKIAFAQHQSSLAKMDTEYGKCSGVRKIDWSDGLKEWYRSTWTLQDDPCNRYYEVLMVNPILLVPPTKAISVTITTFITEPLKHIGQGISEFLRALLKDLPITLQLPVLFTIVLSILVVMYGGVQAVFQHGIMAPLRGIRRDPLPAPVVDQLQLTQLQPAQLQPAQLQPAQLQPAQLQPAQLQPAQLQPAQLQPAQLQPAQLQPAQVQPAKLVQASAKLKKADPWAAGDAPQCEQEERAAGGVLRQRGPQRTREAAAAAATASPRVSVETLGNKGYSQNETDATEPVVERPDEEVLRCAADPHAEGDGDSDEQEEEVEVLQRAAPRTVAQDAKKQAEAKAKPSDPKPNVPQAKRQDDVKQGGTGVTTGDQKPATLAGSTGEQSLSPEFCSSRVSVEETSPTQ